MENHLKFLWLLVIMWAICFANARQIRISRYTTEVSDAATDDAAYSDGIDAIEIEAIVREIKLVPYPAAGYRPSKAFLLPNEIASDLRDNESATEQSLSTSTIADEVDVTTATTEGYDASETTTTAINENENDANEVVNAPYPAAGFRPKIPFNLPTANLLKDQKEQEPVNAANDEETTKVVDTTELADTTQESATITPLAEFTTPATADAVAKTPYPPAGFKPSIVFFLPNADLFNDQAESFRPEPPVLSKVNDTTELEAAGEDSTTIGYLDATEESFTKTPLAEFTTPAATVAEPQTPYPPAGFKPKILFILPTNNLVKNQQLQVDATTSAESSQLESTTTVPEPDVKAPYPAAGFRPLKAFLLPNEQLKQEKEEQVEDNKKSKMEDNSKHPACGSSTNPLAPKPLEGEMNDPDSETIFTRPQTVVVPARLTAQPQIASRPVTYTTRSQA